MNWSYFCLRLHERIILTFTFMKFFMLTTILLKSYIVCIVNFLYSPHSKVVKKKIKRCHKSLIIMTIINNEGTTVRS